VRRLDLRFESDVVLAGVIQSIGKGNLRGIRHLLKTWPTPIRGAVCMESGELGRLNYYADGMIRGEIICQVDPTQEGVPPFSAQRHPGDQ
jgi:tripeptide aminopeptidase